MTNDVKKAYDVFRNADDKLIPNGAWPPKNIPKDSGKPGDKGCPECKPDTPPKNETPPKNNEPEKTPENEKTPEDCDKAPKRARGYFGWLERRGDGSSNKFCLNTPKIDKEPSNIGKVVERTCTNWRGEAKIYSPTAILDSVKQGLRYHKGGQSASKSSPVPLLRAAQNAALISCQSLILTETADHLGL